MSAAYKSTEGKRVKLTVSQRRILENLVAGRPSTAGFRPGMSVSGGLTQTFMSLRRRGLLDFHNKLTDAGRAAIEPPR